MFRITNPPSIDHAGGFFFFAVTIALCFLSYRVKEINKMKNTWKDMVLVLGIAGAIVLGGCSSS